MLVCFVCAVGGKGREKGNRLAALLLREYRFFCLGRQILRNKDVDGGKEGNKGEQHGAEDGKRYFSFYVLHSPPSPVCSR